MKIYELLNPKKEYLKGKKALIFDMDGTLIDSMKYWNHPSRYGASDYLDMEEFIKDKYSTVIEPKPRALELLTLLRENGIPVCIASDTPRYVSKDFLEKYNIDSLINFYISSEDVGCYKAQSPKIFEAAAEKFGFSNDECVIFEDRLAYCKAAKPLGFTVVGVYDDDSRDDMPELSHICDDYIYNIGKMMKSPLFD